MTEMTESVMKLGSCVDALKMHSKTLEKPGINAYTSQILFLI